MEIGPHNILDYVSLEQQVALQQYCFKHKIEYNVDFLRTVELIWRNNLGSHIREMSINGEIIWSTDIKHPEFVYNLGDLHKLLTPTPNYPFGTKDVPGIAYLGEDNKPDIFQVDAQWLPGGERVVKITDIPDPKTPTK